MDNVQSVQKLPENLAGLVYHEDPKVYSLDPDKTYNKVLIIKVGKRLSLSFSLSLSLSRARAREIERERERDQKKEIRGIKINAKHETTDAEEAQ